VDNGACADPITSDMVSIFVFDENNLDANAGLDQQVCTPVTNAIMTGSAVTFPAVGTWTLVSGQGTIADINDPATNITGLGIGSNIFTWTVNNGICANGITSDEIEVILFDANAPPANAGTDQSMCSPMDEAELNANSPVGNAIGIWTVTQGTGNFSDANDPNTSVTGLVVGENILTWSLESGDCVTTSDNVSIFVFDPENLIADAGLDQEMCVPQDSVFMAGSDMIFPASGTWTLISGTGTPIDANDPGTMIAGLSEGVNIFQWEVSNGPCPIGLTTDLVQITVYGDTTAAANAGPDMETCIPITTVQLQGEDPPAPAQGTWTILTGTGIFQDVNDPATSVSGLAQGINTFIWTLNWEPCPNNGILTDTIRVFVFDPLAPIADAGPDQQICGPGVQGTMMANVPSVPGVGTWTVLQGNSTIQSPNEAGTLVDGLDVGVHVFLWTIYNGMCGFGPPSVDTVRISIFDSEAPEATTGEDISICTPTNSAVLQANDAVFPATGTWVLMSGSGTIADPNDPMTTVYDLGVGQNDLQWTVDNGPCGMTMADMSVFLFDGEMTDANAGSDQILCTPGTSTSLQADPLTFPAIGNWTLVSGTGVIDDATVNNTTVSGLSIGNNVFEWSAGNGPCGASSDQVTITVYDEAQPVANAGTDQQLCSPVDNVTLQGSPVAFPATGTWVFESGSGTLSDPNSPTATMTGIALGTTILQWVVDNGPCASGITTDQVSITVFDGSQQNAAAGPDQAFCTPIMDEVTMFANAPGTSAIGTWTIINGPATIGSMNDPFTAVTGLGLGSNVLLWTVENGACGTSSDEIGIMVYDSEAAAADAGPGLDFCQDMITTEFQAVPATSTSIGTWSLFSGTGIIESEFDPNTAVSGLQVGENFFTWSVYNGPFAAGDPCGPTSDTMRVMLKDCLTLTIPDAFSPNGDGVNDFYQILNLESYPENSLQVFNRWGTKIVDRTPYLNDWDGTSQFGTAFGEKLPESTYYYVLDIGDGKDAHTGFIFLRR
nr:gliding motility-associated C-terminal domain-containing protein [Bacteroidota bacterium]